MAINTQVEDVTHEPGLTIPEVLPVLPLRNVVIYPMMGQGLTVGQERSVRLVDDAMRGDRLIALATQVEPNEESPGPEGVRTVGTVGRILQMMRRPDGVMLVAVQGLERIRLHEYVAVQPYLMARVELYPDSPETGLEVEALRRTVADQFRHLVELSPTLPDELAVAATNVDDPRALAYLIANSISQTDLALRQEVLELNPVSAKLQRLTRFLVREIEVLEVGRRIQGQAREEIDKTQREYMLREQLRVIQRELGEEDEQQAEVNELRSRLDEAGLPPEVRKQADRELSRLEKLPPVSPEHSVIRTYLDWIASLPWSISTGAEIDVPRARQILDEDHYDLEKIKDRILEYLAVRKMKAERAAALRAEGGEEPEAGVPNTEREGRSEPILCFVGPPGVGKTSLGQSIARALNRKFIRLSLGGVRDEAEIRGHRRTYIGAMPGTIIQAIRRAEANDPVFMLDEIDKVGADWRGDPSSALLEVLDPEQNKDFRDNYLDLPFDLSRVMFITTANTLDTIPAPLQDRMEVLQLAGYTEEEHLILTGQLGDVMRESAQAALTCVRSLSDQLGIPPEAWQNATIHIHVPAGAVPKDGPSAGVTIATALASLMTGRPVRHDVAMTGEITLRGKVLPIGGLKEKVLGAHRAGITTIIFPRRNERDLEDIPDELRRQLTFLPVDDVSEVLDAALTKVQA